MIEVTRRDNDTNDYNNKTATAGPSYTKGGGMWYVMGTAGVG